MKLTIKVSLDNDAMQDVNDIVDTVTRALNRWAKTVVELDEEISLVGIADKNGNYVGALRVD
jgi:hypothetical protein